MLTFLFFLMKKVIIFLQNINTTYAKHCIKSTVVRFSSVFCDEIICNFFKTFRAFKKFLCVDCFNIRINVSIAPFFFLVPSDIFHRKFQNIIIPNSICNNIFMQAIFKKSISCCRSSVYFSN